MESRIIQFEAKVAGNTSCIKLPQKVSNVITITQDVTILPFQAGQTINKFTPHKRYSSLVLIPHEQQ